MKTTEKFIDEVIEMTKKGRKIKRIRQTITVCACVATLATFVGCSNILNFDSKYLTAYENYLSPYISANADEEQVGLKFIDSKSAIVSVGQTAYPCSVQAKDEDSFELTNRLTVENNEETQSVEDEQPNVFYVDFWENNATISFSILGIEIEKILSVTDEMDIPAGVWKLFATKDGDGELVYKDNGAGWTVILENGDSYSGEGRDSAWVTKFISINNSVFQCLFDAKSGVIIDASLVTYDTVTFGYPVMIERYVSDGLENPHYFYSRLLQDDEKTEFSGGAFMAGAVTYKSEIRQLPDGDALIDSVAKWQLLPEKQTKETKLDVETYLELREDKTVELEIKGDRKYRGRITGQWFALQHSVLVVLDEKSPLVGQTFTLYVDGSSLIKPSETDYLKKAKTSLELYKCYKVGYGKFDYYVMEEEVKLYWGEQYADGNIEPKLVYEKKYVLNAMWCEPYYTEENFSWGNYDGSGLMPCPANGKVFLVFHEDGTVDVTYDTGVTVKREYRLDPYVKFDGKIYLYNDSKKDLAISFLGLGFDSLAYSSSVHDNDKSFVKCYVEFVLIEE